MSTMRFIVSTSGYGRFGMGLHFAQLVEESRHAGELYGYMATRIRPGDERIAITIRPPLIRRYRKYLPVRISQARWYEILSRGFAGTISNQLPSGPNSLMTFAGRSRAAIDRARALGYETIELISANSHINNVVKQHEKASRETGINDSWISKRTHKDILHEYEEADRIFVHSEYTRQSFIDNGISPDKLYRTHLVPNPRFTPPKRRTNGSVFHIVYVGRIDSSKGVHILLDAFKKLQVDNAKLTLVGGWTTGNMKRYIHKAIEDDDRISASPGDPLPILHRASVLVHPSYEDGFAYSPLEALCCGVPVIVTEDTGMKEYVCDGENGFVIPTGEGGALVDRLHDIHQKPMHFDAKKLRKQFYP